MSTFPGSNCLTLNNVDIAHPNVQDHTLPTEIFLVVLRNSQRIISTTDSFTQIIMPNPWTGVGNPYTRQEMLERLNDTLSKGESIIAAGAGTGISAKLTEKGGADLIIINHQATDLDPIADLVIPHSIGAVLSAAAGLDQVNH